MATYIVTFHNTAHTGRKFETNLKRRACQSRSEFSRPLKMWSKILYVLVIASAAFAKTDVLLDSMYGLEGRNRMAVCVRSSAGWRHCDAALYSRDWLLARAHCVGAREPHALAVARVALGGSCATLPADGTRRCIPILFYRNFDRIHSLLPHQLSNKSQSINRYPGSTC